MKLQPKHAAHVVMVIFAGASLFNIFAFFQMLEDNFFLSLCLSVALAAVLVVMAALLSELHPSWMDGKFLTLLIVTTGLTIVSGAIQGAAYSNTMLGGWGWGLGFALPGLGELGLALAISAYGRSLDGREVTEAQRQLSVGVRRHLVKAIDNVDQTVIEQHVNRAVSRVTRELVEGVVVSMVAEMRAGQPKIAVSEPVQIAELQQGSTEKTEILHEKEDNIAKMNAARRDGIARRRAEILQLIEGDGLSIEEIAKRSSVSTRTIRDDLKALQSAGHSMSINGVVKRG